MQQKYTGTPAISITRKGEKKKGFKESVSGMIYSRINAA